MDACVAETEARAQPAQSAQGDAAGQAQDATQLQQPLWHPHFLFRGWDGDGYVMAVMAWLWLLGPLGPGPEGMWLRQLWQWTKIHRCANSAGTLQHTLIISSIFSIVSSAESVSTTDIRGIFVSNTSGEKAFKSQGSRSSDIPKCSSLLS